MRKKELLFVLLLALLPFLGWAQQKNYDGQHVSFKRTTGDSIQYDICDLGRYGNGKFKPIIKDGNVVWSFGKLKDSNDNVSYEELFSLDNVESVDFRSFEYDERESRKALIDFYQAMDGDNWPEEDKENWCSDKPIWEWAGVNQVAGVWKLPWVFSLELSLYLDSPRQIPDCISRMGPITWLGLGCNFIGSIPEFLGWDYNLLELALGGGLNNLSGTFPKSFMNFAKMPSFWNLSLCRNKFEGQLPEELIVSLMDKTGNGFDFSNNYFSGKVPEAIKNHPKFRDSWPLLLRQEGEGLDLSDVAIPAPVFTFKDVNGNTVDLEETYKKNKYTLLYKWGWWCSWSELFNQMLIPACNGYKDKGLEVIGLHIAQDMQKEETELKEYVANHSIPWNNALMGDWNYVDGGVRDGTYALMWTSTTPNVFLVDQNGNIVFNSYMDENGNDQVGTLYRDKLFSFLEEKLGPVDYNFYTSTDFSKDGEVTTLQTATTGQGVDLVFVGEGFTDKDIAEGNFDQRVNEAVNQFFAYEPYSSLRDRFNIYAVKAVSPNAEFYGNATHAIDEDNAKALEYATKVTTLIPNRPMHVNVIYNNVSGGRSYCTMFSDDSYICYAMEGANDVLNHEAGGHGIGKLLDEYVEYPGETLPEEKKTELESQWTTLSWGANVDWRSNPTEVKWAKFINDARYSDEQIGVYEGSYLYEYGAYRPTLNSMMRYNDMPFNAPSREEIYKRVMKESEGEGWKYDYESFVAFDAAGHSQFVDALNTNAARQKRAPKTLRELRTAPPVFIKGTWRDAMKKK